MRVIHRTYKIVEGHWEPCEGEITPRIIIMLSRVGVKRGVWSKGHFARFFQEDDRRCQIGETSVLKIGK